jgi:hypothetical protein
MRSSGAQASARQALAPRRYHFTILEEPRRPDGKLVRAALDLVGKT